VHLVANWMTPHPISADRAEKLSAVRAKTGEAGVTICHNINDDAIAIRCRSETRSI
jgi:hypothetical protein